MIKFIYVFLIVISQSLTALTYDETVKAYEEALENQSMALYTLKCQKEEQRNELLRQAFRNSARKAKEAEVNKMINENFERLSQ